MSATCTSRPYGGPTCGAAHAAAVVGRDHRGRAHGVSRTIVVHARCDDMPPWIASTTRIAGTPHRDVQLAAGHRHLVVLRCSAHTGRALSARMLLRTQMPVMFDDSSDASHSTVLATSSGWLSALQVEARHVLGHTAGLRVEVVEQRLGRGRARA